MTVTMRHYLRLCTSATLLLLTCAGCVSLQKSKKACYCCISRDRSDSVTSIRWDTADALGKQRSVSFNHTPTKNVLRAVEILYGAKVSYRSPENVPYIEFSGKIYAAIKIRTVLQSLHYVCGDLHFRYNASRNEVTVVP